jgi:hypothetical protein
MNESRSLLATIRERLVDHRGLAIVLGFIAFTLGTLGLIQMDVGQWAGVAVVLSALITGEVGYENGRKAGFAEAKELYHPSPVAQETLRDQGL